MVSAESNPLIPALGWTRLKSMRKAAETSPERYNAQFFSTDLTGVTQDGSKKACAGHSLVPEQAYGPCHGALAYMYNADLIFSVYHNSDWWAVKGSAPYGEKSFTAGSIIREMEETYLNWLSTMSPYADAFIKNQDTADMYDVGIVFDAQCNTSIMAAACIASRHPSEWPTMIKLWYKLSDSGINPDLAFVLANIFSGRDEESGLNMVKLASSSHHAYYVPNTLNATRNFLKHEYEKKVSFKESTQYSGVHSIFGSMRKQTYLDQLYRRHLKAMDCSYQMTGFGAGVYSLAPNKTKKYTHEEILEIAWAEDAWWQEHMNDETLPIEPEPKGLPNPKPRRPDLCKEHYYTHYDIYDYRHHHDYIGGVNGSKNKRQLFEAINAHYDKEGYAPA